MFKTGCRSYFSYVPVEGIYFVGPSHETAFEKLEGKDLENNKKS